MPVSNQSWNEFCSVMRQLPGYGVEFDEAAWSRWFKSTLTEPIMRLIIVYLLTSKQERRPIPADIFDIATRIETGAVQGACTDALREVQTIIKEHGKTPIQKGTKRPWWYGFINDLDEDGRPKLDDEGKPVRVYGKVFGAPIPNMVEGWPTFSDPATREVIEAMAGSWPEFVERTWDEEAGIWQSQFERRYKEIKAGRTEDVTRSLQTIYQRYMAGSLPGLLDAPKETLHPGERVPATMSSVIKAVLTATAGPTTVSVPTPRTFAATTPPAQIEGPKDDDIFLPPEE